MINSKFEQKYLRCHFGGGFTPPPPNAPPPPPARQDAAKIADIGTTNPIQRRAAGRQSTILTSLSNQYDPNANVGRKTLLGA